MAAFLARPLRQALTASAIVWPARTKDGDAPWAKPAHLRAVRVAVGAKSADFWTTDGTMLARLTVPLVGPASEPFEIIIGPASTKRLLDLSAKLSPTAEVSIDSSRVARIGKAMRWRMPKPRGDVRLPDASACAELMRIEQYGPRVDAIGFRVALVARAMRVAEAVGVEILRVESFGERDPVFVTDDADGSFTLIVMPSVLNERPAKAVA